MVSKKSPKQDTSSRAITNLYLNAPDIPDEWIDCFQGSQSDDGIYTGLIQGRPTADWLVYADSPPMFAIAVMLSGRLTGAFDGAAAEVDLQPGMVLVMSTEKSVPCRDRYVGGADFKMCYITLPPCALQRLTGYSSIPLSGKLLQDGSLPGLGTYLGVSHAPAHLIRTVHDILSCRIQGETARALSFRAKTLEILAIVLEDVIQVQGGRPLPIPSDRNRLLQAQTLLQNTCERGWLVETLARAVGLNEKRLQSGFQAMFGMSVHAKLTQIRMDTAGDLLLQGTPVSEAAYAVGFSSLSHFSKAFRTAKGVTPKRWAMYSRPYPDVS